MNKPTIELISIPSDIDSDDLNKACDLLSLFLAGKLTSLAKVIFNLPTNVERNQNSGFIYLLDSDYNCLLPSRDNPDLLDLWIILPYSGEEGFLNDFFENCDLSSFHSEDLDYLKALVDSLPFSEQQKYLHRISKDTTTSEDIEVMITLTPEDVKALKEFYTSCVQLNIDTPSILDHFLGLIE